MRWSCLFLLVACAPSFKPGAEPSLKGQLDKSAIAPGESATLTWQTSREADYVIFIGPAIIARDHAFANATTAVSIPSTALQDGTNTIAVAAFTADGSSAHLPLTLQLVTPGGGSSAGSSSAGGSSAGASSGSSSGGIGNAFAIGGTVAGLYGSGLSVHLASNTAPSETLAVPSDAATFTFATLLPLGSAYTVSIVGQPVTPAQACTLTAASGSVSASTPAVSVTCSARVLSDIPRVMFSDLTQAPAGAYVTLYGFNLDGTGARVAVGAAATAIKVDVAAAPARSNHGEVTPLQRVVVQLPSAIAAGSQPLVFYKWGHSPSSALPFSVVAGRVLFYAPTAAGTPDGSETAPFAYSAALSGVANGDVRYLRAGNFGGFTWSAATTLALVGYPGETVNVTATGAPVLALSGSNLTVANLTLGPTAAAYGNGGGEDVVISGSNSRLVGNILPMAHNTVSGIFQIYLSGASTIALLGNHLLANDNGSVGGGNIEIGDSSSVSNLDIGYNELAGCRDAGPNEGGALAFHGYSAGNDATIVSIHHNRVSACEQGGELVGLQTHGGAALSQVVIRNNLFLAYGGGGGRGTFYVNFGSAQNDVTVDHNTIVDNEHIINVDTQTTSTASLIFQNNIVVGSGATQNACAYGNVACSGMLTPISSHNIWTGVDQVPSGTGDSMSPPALNADRALTASSTAAIDQAIIASGLTDYVGVDRPQGAAPDIGAFEYAP